VLDSRLCVLLIAASLTGCCAPALKKPLKIQDFEHLVRNLRQDLTWLDFGPKYETRVPLSQWEQGKPTEPQLANCRKGRDYAVERGGHLGMVVIHRGEIVFEHYQPGTDEEDERQWSNTRTSQVFSATKSLAGVLVGVALKNRDTKLKSLDQPVYELLPGLLEGRQGEQLSRAKALTIRHLLNMNSGLKRPSVKYFTTMLRSPEKQRHFDYVRHMLGAKFEHDPGTHWRYFSGQLELLSGALRAAFGQRVEEYAEAKLFKKLGMRVSRLSEDSAGNAFFFAGMFTSARDLAKLGQCLVEGELLPEKWYEEALKSPGGEDNNRGYGLTLWLNKPHTIDYFGNRHPDAEVPWPSAPEDAAAFFGFMNNNVYVIPSLQLVVVRTSDGESLPPSRKWIDDEFLRAVLGPEGGKTDWK
tara:strand:- start:312 stop:1550 length:1239 start_codon:yes stop_codon:yes gene_type:complete